MEWFKHWNSASDGQSFELIIAEKDYETGFIYWWLLEQVSKFEDCSSPEKRGRITLNFSYFKRKLGLNFQRTSRVLTKIAKTFNLEISINLDETIEVFVPKWLELQENRGGKNKAKNEQSFSKKRQEVRSKSKEVEVETTPTINSNNSVSAFNARFSSNRPEFEKILVECNIKQELIDNIGQIINRFVEPKEFDLFVSDVEKAYERSKKPTASPEEDLRNLKRYVVVSVKKQIGVLK